MIGMSVGARTGTSLTAWSLSGLAVALFAGFAVLSAAGSSARGPRVGAVEVLVFVLFLAYAAVGALVSSRRPANPIGWLLLCQGLLFELTAFSLGYVKQGLFARPGSLPAATWMAWVGQWIWIPEFFALPALFFLLFPDGRLRSGRMRVVASFAFRFRGSRGAERAQLKWLAYAAVLLVLSFAAGDLLQTLGLPGSVTSLFWVVPVALIPVAAGIAVFRYLLYDIDILISKTIIFGALVAFATAVYAAMVAGIGAAVGRTTGSNVGLAIAATAATAVAFQPVRERMHRRLRRVVFGPPTAAELDAG